jgi:hypothetical protein
VLKEIKNLHIYHHFSGNKSLLAGSSPGGCRVPVTSDIVEALWCDGEVTLE